MKSYILSYESMKTFPGRFGGIILVNVFKQIGYEFWYILVRARKPPLKGVLSFTNIYRIAHFCY